MIGAVVELHRAIVKQAHAHLKRGGLHRIGQRFFRKIRPKNNCLLARDIAHPQNGQHVPVIKRRCHREKRKGNVIIIGNNGKQDVGMEIGNGNQPIHQDTAHFLNGVD